MLSRMHSVELEDFVGAKFATHMALNSYQWELNGLPNSDF